MTRSQSKSSGTSHSARAHYLGHTQTLDYMTSEYLYPALADRTPPGTWEELGHADMLERAHEKVATLLSSHYPAHVDRATDDTIRERFPIRLSRQDMQPGNGRW